MIWASIWYVWFRDSPEERIGTAGEGGRYGAERHGGGHVFPWRAAFQSKNVVALLVLGFSYIYTFNFFQTWFHTFLVKGRGFSEEGLLLSALPYAVAACSNLLGGAVSDALVRRFGRTKGRRGLGVICLTAAGMLVLGAMITHGQIHTVVLLSAAYGAITFQQSGAFSVCLDISRQTAGAMSGLFNTACYLGGLVSSVAFGYIVDRFGSYDGPFVPMAVLLFLGAMAWLRIDASQELMQEFQAVGIGFDARQAREAQAATSQAPGPNRSR
jgi:predicted MFS family arabinose efflux permease